MAFVCVRFVVVLFVVVAVCFFVCCCCCCCFTVVEFPLTISASVTHNVSYGQTVKKYTNTSEFVVVFWLLLFCFVVFVVRLFVRLFVCSVSV